jgi:hypothetical protein
MTPLVEAALAEVRRRRETTGQMSPPPWSNTTGFDGATLREYLRRTTDGDGYLLGRDAFADFDVCGVVDLRNHAEATLALLEALLEYWEGSVRDCLCDECSDADSKVEQRLAEFVKLEGV